jgi:nickel-dependent lactate racemase
LVDVKLPYGNREIRFDIPEGRISGFLVPKDVAGAPDAYSTVCEAIQNPVDGFGLLSAARGENTVVIITDDHTRPTRAGPICRAIIDQLNELGIDDDRVTILAAGGLHRPMSENEIQGKFGEDLVKRVEIKTHDAWDEKQLEYLGQTSRGTPVWINKLAVRTDLRIAVGMITAHFVAGYGSGPKTIVPGASGYRTIFHNHGVVSTSPDARIGVTRGNPCWEDMAEVIGFLGTTLAVDVVLNTRDEIVAAFHGKPLSAQRAGLHLYDSIYGFRTKEKADIVIAGANPMYAYLDLCLKTIIPASMLVRDGGARIVASPCEELLGPPFLRELYYKSLSPGWPSVDEYAQMMRSGAVNDIADAVGILKFLQSNNSKLTLVCDPSFDDDLTNLGFAHAPNVQEALDEATLRLGTDSKVLVVPYGAVTHPVCKDREGVLDGSIGSL